MTTTRTKTESLFPCMGWSIFSTNSPASSWDVERCITLLFSVFWRWMQINQRSVCYIISFCYAWSYSSLSYRNIFRTSSRFCVGPWQNVFAAVFSTTYPGILPLGLGYIKN